MGAVYCSVTLRRVARSSARNDLHDTDIAGVVLLAAAFVAPIRAISRGFVRALLGVLLGALLSVHGPVIGAG